MNEQEVGSAGTATSSLASERETANGGTGAPQQGYRILDDARVSTAGVKLISHEMLTRVHDGLPDVEYVRPGRAVSWFGRVPLARDLAYACSVIKRADGHTA